MSDLKRNIQGVNDGRLEDGNTNRGILRSSISSRNIPWIGPRDAESYVYSTPLISKSKISLVISGKYIDDDEYGNLISSYEFIRIYITNSNSENVDIKVTSLSNFTISPETTTIEGIIISGDPTNISINDKVSWSFFFQDKEEKNYPVNLYAGDITNSTAKFSWKDSTNFKEAKYYQVMWRELGTQNWLFSTVINDDIYNVTGLSSNTTYEWSVMCYLSNDLKNFSRYAPSLKFTTR
jgi:hypothetical protein